MTDLFTYADGLPGHKENTTSLEAAEKVAPKAITIRTFVLAALGVYGPMTADECAEYLCESILSVRPRFSELAKAGKIVKTGERRKNASGMSAHVWMLA